VLEDGYAPLPNTEVKNAWSHTSSLPYASLFYEKLVYNRVKKNPILDIVLLLFPSLQRYVPNFEDIIFQMI